MAKPNRRETNPEKGKESAVTSIEFYSNPDDPERGDFISGLDFSPGVSEEIVFVHDVVEQSDESEDEETLGAKNTRKNGRSNQKSSSSSNPYQDDSIRAAEDNLKGSNGDSVAHEVPSSRGIRILSPSSFFHYMDSSTFRLAKSYHQNDQDEARKPHLCCLSCCDLRKACVIVDVIDFVFSIAVVILSALGFQEIFLEMVDFSSFLASDQDDDAVAVMVMISLGILFAIVGIIGAWTFRPYLLLSNGLWRVVTLVFWATTQRYMSVLLAGVFSYPHFAFFWELRKGRITAENYPTEAYCCWNVFCEKEPPSSRGCD